MINKTSQYCSIIAVLKIFGWCEGEGIFWIAQQIFKAEGFYNMTFILLQITAERTHSVEKDEGSEDHVKILGGR